MSQSHPYRWAAVAAVAAGLAVISAWAAPSTAPSTAPVPTTAQAAPWASSVGWSRRDRGRSAPLTATTSPAIASTTPTPMSPAFSAVQYRSIFLKGSQEIGHVRDPYASRGGDTRPPPSPQSVLVFNGVTLVGDRADAMIEDTSAHKVFSVRAGEMLAGGRVAAITFDNLDYQHNGKVTRVGLGQTLEGTDAAPGSTVAPATGANPAAADSAPTLGNTTGMSPEDILARMKKRRQQEMGGK